MGYSSDEKDRLLLAAILGAVTGGLLWGRVVDAFCPRNALLTIPGAGSTGSERIRIDRCSVARDRRTVGRLHTGGIWATGRPLMTALSPSADFGKYFGLYGLAGRLAGLSGPLVWVLISQILGLGRPAALVALLALVSVAMLLLRAIPNAIGHHPA